MNFKALAVTASFLLLSVAAYCQTYFVPNIGIGISNARQQIYAETGFRHSYRAGIDIQRHINRLQLGVGVSYFTSGYKVPGPHEIYDSRGSNLGTTDLAVVYEFQHIGAPITIGYKISSKGGFSVTPTVGVEPTYNIGGRSRVFIDRSYDDLDKSLSKISDDEFSRYGNISIFALAQLKFNFSFRKKFGVFAGPSFRYMVTNFRDSDKPFSIGLKQNNYVLGIDAGLRIRI